jgi:predicted GIY-YIG superfamily endonuclease
MKYVYILESLDSEHFYVGITDDLRARLAKHNAGGSHTLQNTDLGESRLTWRSATKRRPSHSKSI